MTWRFLRATNRSSSDLQPCHSLGITAIGYCCYKHINRFSFVAKSKCELLISWTSKKLTRENPSSGAESVSIMIRREDHIPAGLAHLLSLLLGAINIQAQRVSV